MQGIFGTLSPDKHAWRTVARVAHKTPRRILLEVLMSDVSSGARAPDLSYPAETDPAYTPATPSPYEGAGSSGGEQSTTKQVAQQGKQATGQAVSEVTGTAREQAQRLGAEAKTQVRHVAADVRGRVSEQARSQNDRLVDTIRQTADQLDEMRGDRAEGPAATVVSRVADSGRQLADYLDHNGPEGVLREVQDFARRRPGAFLATALAAGFVVGRLGKSVAKADSDAGRGKPASDSYVSAMPQTDTVDRIGGPIAEPAYPPVTPETPGTTGAATTGTTGTTGLTGTAVTTEYALTGTGTPVVVEEEYVLDPPSTGYPGGTR